MNASPPIVAGLCALVFLLGPSPNARAMDFIAHRGASDTAPENTMAAFRLAIEQGADGFECDVYTTKDGRVVCIHDPTTARTTLSHANRTVTDSTLAELRQLDFGGWKNPAYKDEPIPLLEDVLALARDDLTIYVELKQGNGLLDAVRLLVQAQPKATPNRVVFISFRPTYVTGIRTRLPAYDAFLIRESPPPDKTPADFATDLTNLHATGFSCQYGPAILADDFIPALHDAGLFFNVWTVDSPDHAATCQAAQVDSLTSNKARRMMSEVGSRRIPPEWWAPYPDLLAKYDHDPIAAGMAETGKHDANGRPMQVWQDYIAGTSPLDPDSRLRIFIGPDGALRWEPDLGNARIYCISGKTSLSDETWISPINDRMRFFRISTSLP